VDLQAYRVPIIKNAEITTNSSIIRNSLLLLALNNLVQKELQGPEPLRTTNHHTRNIMEKVEV